MFAERTGVGHARSVVAAAIDGVTGEFFQTRLTPSQDWAARGPSVAQRDAD